MKNGHVSMPTIPEFQSQSASSEKTSVKSATVSVIPITMK